MRMISRSARLPGSRLPTSSWQPSATAASSVPIRKICAGATCGCACHEPQFFPQVQVRIGCAAVGAHDDTYSAPQHIGQRIWRRARSNDVCGDNRRPPSARLAAQENPSRRSAGSCRESPGSGVPSRESPDSRAAGHRRANIAECQAPSCSSMSRMGPPPVASNCSSSRDSARCIATGHNRSRDSRHASATSSRSGRVGSVGTQCRAKSGDRGDLPHVPLDLVQLLSPLLGGIAQHFSKRIPGDGELVPRHVIQLGAHDVAHGGHAVRETLVESGQFWRAECRGTGWRRVRSLRHASGTRLP